MLSMLRRSVLPLLFAGRAWGQAAFGAGAAKKLITPDPLLPLSGGMGAPSLVKGKQGELMARAIVLRSGGTIVGIASVDLIGFPAVLGDRARKLVPRIPPEQILIGATHTHSGPDSYAFPDGKGGHTGSLEYMDLVVRQVAAALNEAIDRLEAAELRVASGEAKGRIAYNYYAPDLYDRRLSVFGLRSVAGKPIATLLNFAIHPEVLGAKTGLLSPDLVGPLCDTVEQAGGGMALFMNGAQGGMVTADNRDLKQAPRDAIRAYWTDERSWAECERIGGLLGTEAMRIVGTAAWTRQPELVARVARVKFPVESEELWQVVRHSPLKYPHGEDRTITAQLNFLKLGGAHILTIPGEALPNIGFYLKRKMKGEHQFLFGLTNDAFGYILTAVDYQSFPAYRYISRVSLGEQTGEILMREALKLAGN
jgi:hypothetical protein